MNAASQCPSLTELSEYAAGKMPLELELQIGEHLEVCEPCLDALELEHIPLAHQLQKEMLRSAELGFVSEAECEALRARAKLLIGSEPSPIATADRHPDDAPTLISSYEILNELGRGAFGSVHCARHVHLHRLVALKVLHQRWHCNQEAIERFRREIMAVGKVDHPNVVRATDAGVNAGQAFLVMDYLKGLDAGSIVKQHGPLPVAAACEIIRQACEGLEAIRQNGFVHRDLKPSNLFVTAAGVVKILDLGLARAVNANGDGELTESNVILGTFDFMAPEQSSDPRRADIRADLYSLGCTLFKLLTGAAPFADSGPNAAAKILAHSSRSIRLPNAGDNDVELRLQEILDQLTAKPVENRLACPLQAASQLAPFCADHELASLVQSLLDRTIANSREVLEDTSIQPGIASTESIRTPPQKIKRRTWLIAAPVGIALTAGLGYWGCSAFVSNIRQDGWQDLLKRPPETLLWKNVDGGSSWSHDRQREELWVSSDQTAIFGLGKSTGFGFSLSVAVRQQAWTGGIGVVWGFQPSPLLGEHSRIYQAIELRWTPNSAGSTGFGFIRVRRSISDMRLPKPAINSIVLESQQVAVPHRRDYILEITVEESQLSSVRWDGAALDSLSSPDLNDQFELSDYRGAFAVVNSVGACRFSNCRALINTT